MGIKKYNISIKDTEAEFECSEHESVFAAMIRSRKGPVTYGCCGGGCGVCRMKIVSGDYEIYKKMSRAHVSAQDIEQKILLLCCVQPRSDMSIAVVNE